MITPVCGTNGALSFNASVNGIAIYLDNWAIKTLAKGDASLRQRFVAALHGGADILFSIAHAAEITGAQGASSVAFRTFLDELGPHWYPVEFLVFEVVKRESDGSTPDKSCFAEGMLKAFFVSRTSEYTPGSGKVIDLSERFFKLGDFVDWLAPERDSTLRSCAELDDVLKGWIDRLRAKFKKDPGWLDKALPKQQLNPSRAATFACWSLMRGLISDSGYQMKKGDGIDFCHAVMASAFANFATLDKQWKRRVESLPQPNRGTRIYYEPELGAMVDDIESALVQLKASRKSPLASP